MNEKDLMKAIGEVDGDLIDEARLSKKPHGKAVRHLLAAAACLAVIVAGGYYALSNSGVDIPKLTAIGENGNNSLAIPKLTRSSGIRIKKPLIAPKPEAMSADLVLFTEEELINGPFDGVETDIFYATVTDIEHITMDFNGRDSSWSLVMLEVGKVLKGDCKQGDSVVMQLHFPLADDVWVESTGVASQLQVGSTGIFMPTKYAQDSTYITNGATLYLSELSPYGLGDGERFIFLQGESGVVYSTFAYPSLEGCTSLEQVEAFITETLGK